MWGGQAAQTSFSASNGEVRNGRRTLATQVRAFWVGTPAMSRVNVL
jgi:hypothetical protein